MSQKSQSLKSHFAVLIVQQRVHAHGLSREVVIFQIIADVKHLRGSDRGAASMDQSCRHARLAVRFPPTPVWTAAQDWPHHRPPHLRVPRLVLLG